MRTQVQRIVRHRRLGGVIALLCVFAGGLAVQALRSGDDGVVSTIRMTVPHAAGSVLIDAPAGRALVIGGDRRTLVSLVDLRSDRVLRVTTLGGAALGGAAIISGAAIITRMHHAFVLEYSSGLNGPGGAVSMLDTRTGALVRRISVPSLPRAVAVDERTGRVFVVSEGGPATGGGPPGMAGWVSALDARTGSLLWQSRAGIYPSAVAVDARTGRVFVVNMGTVGRNGFGRGTVSVVDARTGRVLRTVTVNKSAVAIAIDEQTNRVFVAHNDSQSVSMLDARTGAMLIRTIPVGFATDLAIDAAARRVVVVNAAPGSVTLLDAASGTVVRTIQVGGDPQAVAIDATRHRAVITGTGTGTTSALQRRFPLPFWVDPSGSDVTILDTLTGRVLQETRVALTRNVAVDAQTGQSFVSNWDADTITVLDAAH